MDDIDYQKKIFDGMIELCKRNGWPVRIYHIPMIPEYERDAWKYVMEIEEAHKKAAHSKTIFGSGYCFA